MILAVLCEPSAPCTDRVALVLAALRSSSLAPQL